MECQEQKPLKSAIALDLFLLFFIYSTHSKESCYHFTAIALNMLAWSVCPGSKGPSRRWPGCRPTRALSRAPRAIPVGLQKAQCEGEVYIKLTGDAL